jgi:diguanylate cyclase (GGDEF)-like protein
VLLVSNHLLEETASRISLAVDRHVIGSVATLKAAFPEKMVAPDSIEQDLENIKTRFWIATSLHTDPNNYVYYGSTSGQAFGLYRHSEERAELRIKFKPEEHRTIYFFEGLNGKPVLSHKEEKLFDPRVRPWFQVAETSDIDIWTSVYIDFGTNDLVATRARRVLDEFGNLKGVVATDMPLRALNTFVSSLDISKNGIAFIIEPNGDLIASSCSPNIRSLKDGKMRRLNAAESENQMLVEVYKQVEKRRAGNTNKVQIDPFYFYNKEGAKVHVAYSRFQDQSGLIWINIVAIPDQDFMGGISHNVRRTIFLAALATLFVVLIGLSILNWVTRDLKKLSFAANQVGSGSLEHPINIRRSDEIGELAQSFQAMQQRLQTDHLTRLPNRYAYEQALGEAICRIESSPIEKFAVMFIDVNDFKKINDKHGHEIGDNVLIELALRLRTQVRKEDMVARFAGDEFVVLFYDIDSRDDLKVIYNKIATALSEPMHMGSGSINLYGAAIGVAYCPEDGTTAKELLIKADHEMYAHKDQLKQMKNDPSL